MSHLAERWPLTLWIIGYMWAAAGIAIYAINHRQANTKLRWFVAARLNRRPKWCWSDLVLWANYRGDQLTSARDVTSCRADAARCGVCHCGKFRTQETQDEGNLVGRGVIVKAES
jgi:hypothetical protein